MIIEESFVSPSTNKMLREKGFYKDEVRVNEKGRPTLQTVRKWLKKHYGIVIEICVRHNTKIDTSLPLFEYQWVFYCGYNKKKDKGHFFEYEEECIEDCIRYCLQNLL